MDIRIWYKAQTLLSSFEYFSTESTVQYMVGYYNDNKYIISMREEQYTLSENGKNIAAGATADQILDALSCIKRGERYPISETTKVVTRLYGAKLAYH